MREAKDDRPRDDPILHSDRKERRAFAARARITLLNHSTPSKCNAKKEQQGSKRKKEATEVARAVWRRLWSHFLCPLFFSLDSSCFYRRVFDGRDDPTGVFHFVFVFDFCHRERRDNTRQASRPQDHEEKKKGNNRSARCRRHRKRKQKREEKGLVAWNGAGQTLRKGAMVGAARKGKRNRPGV